MMSYVNSCRSATGQLNDAQSSWAAGRMDMGPILSMILTPNSQYPDCTYYPAPAGMFAFRSRHSGGVNTLFADGSVHFIKSSVSPITWWCLAPRPAARPLAPTATELVDILVSKPGVRA